MDRHITKRRNTPDSVWYSGLEPSSIPRFRAVVATMMQRHQLGESETRSFLPKRPRREVSGGGSCAPLIAEDATEPWTPGH